MFFWNGQEQELLGKFQYHGQLCMGLHQMIQCSADAVTVSISLLPCFVASPFEVKSLWNCCSNFYFVLVLVGIVLVAAYRKTLSCNAYASSKATYGLCMGEVDLHTAPRFLKKPHYWLAPF